MLEGIDVSEHQGQIDWGQVITARKFAMIRASYSGAKDKMLDRNKDEARNTGILRGFYHYAYPQYSPDPVADARQFTQFVGDLRDGEVLALDVEEHWGGNWVDWAKKWLDEVFRITGRRPLVYMNDNFDNMYDWKPVVDGNYGLWLAYWDNNTQNLPATDWPFVAIKQYIVGGPGAVPGIAGRIDLDVFYGDEEQFKKYGAQAQAPAAPQPTPTPPAPVQQQIVHTVASGDNLWKIATQYGTSVQRLIQLNSWLASNPNLIHPGDKIVVAPGGAPAPASKTYTVGKGDSLSLIAARLGGTWKSWYDKNRAVIGDNPNFIKPGQVLQYP